MKYLLTEYNTVTGLSLPVRGAWIEIVVRLRREYLDTSLPVRGAWIEMTPRSGSAIERAVAPRAGSVD